MFCDVPDPKASKNVRNVLREYLNNKTVCEKIEPYIVNGGICGHKVMDLAAVVDIVVQFDHVGGGNRLDQFNLNKYALGNQIKNTLRERLMLDKQWKVIGLNPRLDYLPKNVPEVDKSE
jgi:hypothetical protein